MRVLHRPGETAPAAGRCLSYRPGNWRCTGGGGDLSLIFTLPTERSPVLGVPCRVIGRAIPEKAVLAGGKPVETFAPPSHSPPECKLHCASFVSD